MRAFSYAWSFPVTWQRWRIHQSISRIQKNPYTVHANITAVFFYRTGVTASRSFTLRERGFSTFFAPVTLTLTQWPSYCIWTSPVFPGNISYVQLWTSYIRAFESCRPRDRQTRPKLYTTPLRGWSINCLSISLTLSWPGQYQPLGLKLLLLQLRHVEFVYYTVHLVDV